jgi:4-amino-4-deoxy-L-arabinose transferase-like glycosyltransferase
MPRLRPLLLDAAVFAAGFALLHQPLERMDSPPPDARYYAAHAASLAAGEGLWMRIGEARFPPYNPIGLPILIAPAYWLPGDGLGRGLLPVQLAAAALLVLARRAAHALAGPFAGAVAPLLLLLSPEFTSASHWIITEIPFTLLFTLSLVLLLRPASLPRAAAAGVLVGIAGWLRPVGFPLALAALPLLWRPPGPFRRTLAFAAGAALLIPPLLLAQAALYGGPLRSGYHFYGSFFVDYPETGLSWRYALFGGGWLAAPGSPGHLFLYLDDLTGGAHTLLPLPAAALSVFGLARHRRLGLAAAAATALLLVIQSGYYFPQSRYLLPLLPLLAIGAATGAAALVRRHRALAIALLAVGFAFQGGKAWTWLRDRTPPARAAEALRAAAAAMEPDAALASALDPLLVRHYVLRGTARTQLPLLDVLLFTYPRPVPGPLPPTPPGASILERYEAFLAWAGPRGAQKSYLPGLERWLDAFEREVLPRQPVYVEAASRALAPEAWRALEERFRMIPVAPDVWRLSAR